MSRSSAIDPLAPRCACSAPTPRSCARTGNEREVGEAIRRSGVDRDEIFATTKLWISDYGYDAALAGFDASLRRLGLDHVDLYLLHQPMRPGAATIGKPSARSALPRATADRPLAVVSDASGETYETPGGQEPSRAVCRVASISSSNSQVAPASWEISARQQNESGPISVKRQRSCGSSSSLSYTMRGSSRRCTSPDQPACTPTS